ncbi:phosphatase domain-containing protein [Fibrivirga algicola]|nr:AAA family ATPase [Fibrivirga algicola]
MRVLQNPHGPPLRYHTMQHVLILIGISGSGKSTFARQFVQDNPTYLRLNRDDLRRTLISVPLKEYWTWDDAAKSRIEEIVTAQLDAAVRAAIQGGWNCVIDNTHLRLRSINEMLALIESQATRQRPIEVTFRLIDVPPDTAIERDQLRPDGVGAMAIRVQYNRLSKLKRQFNVWHTRHFPGTSLMRCILVDIDGTVAKIHNRSPFDWANVDRDLPNVPVLNVVRAMRAAGYAVIFMSGRDTAARVSTIAWLQRHLGWIEHTDYNLFMRASNDNRKDAVVKRELYDTHIRDQYTVELVLDDRDQVVSIWRRDLGLTCLQVDYGNF